MRNSGNPHQWSDGYPNRCVSARDMSEGTLYGVFSEDRLCGVFFFRVGEDETYNYIENGCWLNSNPYGVIHRIAGDGSCKGILKAAVDLAFTKISDVRIDTHRDNHVMQRHLEAMGFSRCGIIYIKNGEERIAYHKSI